MRKLLTIAGVVIVVALAVFAGYAYKLHSLAVEGNKIFEYRCTNVNPTQIKYKNAYLSFMDALRYPGKYSKDEAVGFMNDHTEGMRKYVQEENVWLEKQNAYMSRWDFQLIEPWYIKQAGDYQYKMYEANRDDQSTFISYYDKNISQEEMYEKTQEAKERNSKYSKLYFDFSDEASLINDWRKFFGRLPVPEACTDENLTIPDTSGATDWMYESTPSAVPEIPELAS